MTQPSPLYSELRYLPWLAAALLISLVASPLLAQDEQSLADLIVQQTYTDDLPGMKKRKRIRALVTYSRTDFFFDDSGAPKGLQVDLMQAFEKQLNDGVKQEVDRVRVEFIPTTFDRLVPDLVEGKGDIAAALLTLTPEREQKISFISSKKQHVSELVVTHKSVGEISTAEDLAGRRLYVMRGSSYAEHLWELNQTFTKNKLKPIEIVEAEHHQLTEDILEMVNAGVVKITVADDYKAKLWAQVLPDIRTLDSVTISTGNTIGWGIRKDSPELEKALYTFLHKVKKGTLLGNMLFKRYDVKTRWINNPNAQEERAKLLALIHVFKKYGDQYGFDYLANAAQGYQESRLDQNKRSGRGAMGIMQLLPSTAASKHVGIPDISEKESNIHAGIKYMAFLRDRYFNDPAISEENRMAFSLAAYNAGPARVREMRNLAKKMNLDPNIWHANVEVAAGKIVGRETVEYVSNIFKYYIAYKLVDEDHDQALSSETN
jgi:membrane-bound lytic murein transglycosylase MltF